MRKIKDVLTKYRLLELFEGENGKLSLSRVGLLMFLVPISIVWTMISIGKYEMQDIPMGVYVFVCILTSAKIGQTIVDKKLGK